jgi:methionyl-tRNA formyltransferase
MLDNKTLKIYRSEKELTVTGIPATAGPQTDGKTFLKFACPDGFIQVKELQLEGKKRMGIEDFLRGFTWK